MNDAADATEDSERSLSATTTFTFAVGEAEEEEADPPPATPPTAEAGPNLEGKRGEEIVLSGSGAPHVEGSQTLSCRWRIVGASHPELAGAARS